MNVRQYVRFWSESVFEFDAVRMCAALWVMRWREGERARTPAESGEKSFYNPAKHRKLRSFKLPK